MADFPKRPPGVERTVSVHEGEQSRDVPYLISENSARKVVNALINEPGRTRVREGTRAFGGRTDGPGGLGFYQKASSEQRLAAIWGSGLYDSSGNGGWAPIATTASFVQDRLHNMVQGRSFQGRALFVWQAERGDSGTSDVSELYVYNIDSNTASGATFRARAAEFFQYRLWAGRDDELIWSQLGDFAFSGANQLLIEPGVGGDITALVATREETPRLMIFKESLIAVLDPRWGSSNALIPNAADQLSVVESSVRILTKGAGCIATATAQWVPGTEGADLFFLAADGVRSLNRAENDVTSGAGLPISWKAKDIFDRVNWSVAHKSTARVYDNAYHIALPLDGSLKPSHVARYDLFNQAWSLHTWEAKALTVAALGDQDRLWMQYLQTAGDCSSTGASGDALHQVYRCFDGPYDPSESTIIFTEQSRAYTLGELFLDKTWDRFQFLVSAAETAVLQIDYRLDFGPWITTATETIQGVDNAIILGDTPLVWDDADDFLRLKQFSLLDAVNSRTIEFRLSTPTASTDIGRPSIFMREVHGHVEENRFEKES